MQYASPFHGFPKSALLGCRSRIISLFFPKSALLRDLSLTPSNTLHALVLCDKVPLSLEQSNGEPQHRCPLH